MILMHKSLKRSDDIMRSLRNYFRINFKSIDGILEVFNNDIGQGYLFKIFQSYNDNNDLVIWMYESLSDKNIKIAYSIHSNVDENNNWMDEDKVNFKEYPIVTDIKKKIIKDIYDTIRDYYGFDEEIEIPKELNI